jgi:hypothetical protein
MTDGFWNLGGLIAIASYKYCALSPTKPTLGCQGRVKGITATGVESCLGFQQSNWCSIDDRIRGRVQPTLLATMTWP